ncbi:UNVERIFIED_CONTAM: hypothetical protein Slati_3064100, partial [Sesamum latifolium]
VCESLNTPVRGGYSYFVTFTNDHSRYGYVYLMRYKSEAFERFKEYRLEVENQIGHKIKALQSNRDPIGHGSIHDEFHEIVRIFLAYVLETAVKLLNIAPSKMVPQTPYEIWYGKSASYKYLRVWGSPTYVKRLVGDKLDSRLVCAGFPTDSRRDEVLLEESSEAPQQNNATSFEHALPTDGVPVLRKSIRESPPPERIHSTTQGLNGFVEEEIFMDQSDGFTSVGEEQKGCCLQRSIYGLKQASRSWNTRFNEVIRGYDFIKNEHDPCVYKRINGSSVAYRVLYVDDILLIGNNVKMLDDMVVHTVFHEEYG